MSRIKDSFSSRKFKGGAYATLVSVIMLAVLIVINLVVTELNVTKDMSADASYSILDSTKDYLAGIDDELTIYYLIPDGSSFKNFDLILDDFESTGKVKVVTKDPNKYPKFASQYTEENISAGSFIVVDESNGRSKYVDYQDIVITEFNYNTYQFDTVGIDLEGRLVSAISYVTTDKLPKMYILTGHGEQVPAANLAQGIAKENVTTEELSLLRTGLVPEDCDILLIYQPAYDMTEEEAAAIMGYIREGGNVIALTDISTPEQTNFVELLKEFGIGMTKNFVLEGDMDYMMMRTPYQIIPDILDHDITREVARSKPAVCPYANGLMILDDADETINFTGLLQTSSSAYAKTSLDPSTYEHEDGDDVGPFYVGLLAEQGTGKLAVYSCMYFLDDNILSYSSYANGDLFYNTLNYLADVDASVSIRSVSLQEEMITVNAAQGGLLAGIYMIIIPLAIIAAGIVVVVRRRRL